MTANRLRDGKVVWLAPGERWAEHVAAAEIFDNDMIDAAIARARVFEEKRVVVDIYGVELDPGQPGTVPVTQREQIRAAGPSVRPELGPRATGAAIHAS